MAGLLPRNLVCKSFPDNLNQRGQVKSTSKENTSQIYIQKVRERYNFHFSNYDKSYYIYQFTGTQIFYSREKRLSWITFMDRSHGDTLPR